MEILNDTSVFKTVTGGNFDFGFTDAILQMWGSFVEELALPNATINGINTATLEKSMAEMDWKGAFDFDIKKQWSVEDKASWDQEQKVESVMERLMEFQSVEEGKPIAVGLKIKYWAGIPYQELIGNVSPLKNKSEVSQRFYFFERQVGISVDEAYRFLQNRWLEKQMQTKRKEIDESGTEENHDNDQASAGNGLLRKKRIGKRKGVKNNK